MLQEYDDLRKLREAVDWENVPSAAAGDFRASCLGNDETLSPEVARPWNVMAICRVLLLDRRSFQHFVGLMHNCDVPDQKTIWKPPPPLP